MTAEVNKVTKIIVSCIEAIRNYVASVMLN